jgi:hypothetical protein
MKTIRPVLTSFLEGNVLSGRLYFFTSGDGLYMTIVPKERLDSIRHEFRGNSLVSSLLENRNLRIDMRASYVFDLLSADMRQIIEFMGRLYSDAVKRQFPGGF